MTKLESCSVSTNPEASPPAVDTPSDDSPRSVSTDVDPSKTLVDECLLARIRSQLSGKQREVKQECFMEVEEATSSSNANGRCDSGGPLTEGSTMADVLRSIGLRVP
ncbi:hypothetical protein AAVH_31120, partial [Aphelenchoides avenae]